MHRSGPLLALRRPPVSVERQRLALVPPDVRHVVRDLDPVRHPPGGVELPARLVRVAARVLDYVFHRVMIVDPAVVTLDLSVVCVTGSIACEVPLSVERLVI